MEPVVPGNRGDDRDADDKREEVYGLGGGYVTEAEPGSLLDQLIINVEATYTPKRTFTAIDLRQAYDKRDEWQVGLVMEKYAIPAQMGAVGDQFPRARWRVENNEIRLNHGTGLMNGTGDLSADGKTITWQYTFNCPINKKPTAMKEIETTTGPKSKTLEMWGADPKSGKVYKMMLIEMTRR